MVEDQQSRNLNYSIEALYDDGSGSAAWHNISYGLNKYKVKWAINNVSQQTGVDLNCTVYNENGVMSTTNPTGTLSIKRAGYIGLYYSGNLDVILAHSDFGMGIKCDIPTSYNYTIRAAFADCTTDGLYDYWWNFNETNSTNILKWFYCKENKPKISTISSGCIIEKNDADSWQSPFCDGLDSSYNLCEFTTKYKVRIE